MKIFKVVILLALVFGLFGCDENQATRFINKGGKSALSYGIDPETHLCFALFPKDPGSLTYVPCTEKVVKKIETDKNSGWKLLTNSD